MNNNNGHTKRQIGSTAATTCCYCGVGCGIIASKDKQGRIAVEGDESHPVNRGNLCSKGMNLHHTVNDRTDRLLYPEMRMNRYLPRERVSWDLAMERTAAVFKILISKYGPDAVAFYASGQCLTEEYYVLNKLVKGFIGTNNIDTNSRLCMSSAVAAYKMSLGEDAVPVCYDDIEAADLIFVAGGNPAWCHPILWRRVEAAKENNPKLRIIVSDPRATQTCSAADLHLQIRPGTDITLHHAIGRCLISNGTIDKNFIENHSEGFEEYKKTVFKRSIEDAAAICGIDADDICTAAEWIGQSRAFLSMWTMGLNQSSVGVQKNLSLINLNLITGQIGKPGAGPFSLTGQPNAMGGREVGGLANLLPAHRSLQNPQHRTEVEQFWKIPAGTIGEKAGLTATEMFEALESGKLKAIWILCTNPLISLPNVRRAEAALRKAKFVVVQEISNKPETLAFADVVFPAAGWLEKEGTMTNAERRINHLSKYIDPPGEAMADADIICRFARQMGFPGFDYNSAEEIFLEHAALTGGTNLNISSLTYARLKTARSIQWPLTSGVKSAPVRLFTDHQFYTTSGKARLSAVDDQNLSVQPTAEFPLILTTGRIRDQWHTMSKTGKINKLLQHLPPTYLEMHPDDARVRNLHADSLVEVKTASGNVRTRLRISTDIRKGVVFLPMHQGKILNNDLNRANNLTSGLTDRISGEPDFKFTAAEISAYRPPRRKIIVVGAGAGACGFVKSHRAINEDDEIAVFSDESFPFYNRVLLPDYISGVLPWNSLVKLTDDEEDELNIKLHRGLRIESIDRQYKTVTDSRGNVHSYDVLILATGSRAAMLRDLPEMNGIFTMRKRTDADNFVKYASAHPGRVVIVGGGLLGIELAASLIEQQVEVTIIQRISRLMDRQLDPLGSQLLHEEMTDKGVDILYNDEIDRFTGSGFVTGVSLKSGLFIHCSSVVIAVGTVPNTELAKNCGLTCSRGVVVDEYLATSDPHIFAIGEIAEFNGFLYGITAAAEQQAAVAARFLNGDISDPYHGSLLMNILKMHGTDLCSLGTVECPDDPAYEEVIFTDKAKRYYKKCIIHNDRLIGAILIGDKNEFLEFRNLIDNKTELSEKRLQLLRSGKATEPVSGKLICSCNQVGEGNLLQKINSGCTDLLQLCQLTGAGTGCGSCRPEVKKLLEEQLQPKIHISRA